MLPRTRLSLDWASKQTTHALENSEVEKAARITKRIHTNGGRWRRRRFSLNKAVTIHPLCFVRKRYKETVEAVSSHANDIEHSPKYYTASIPPLLYSASSSHSWRHALKLIVAESISGLSLSSHDREKVPGLSSVSNKVGYQIQS